MGNKLKTQPLEEPVSLGEIRTQIGISQVDDTERDSTITGRITAARRWLELEINSVFISQSWVLWLDCFYQEKRNYFDLKAPLLSVTSVKYIDTSGNLQTLDAADYTVDLTHSRIYPSYDKSWPVARIEVNSVQIEHISGYADASVVPQEIKEAISIIVRQWENFQSAIEGGLRVGTIAYSALQLVQHHKDYRNKF